MMRAGGTSLEVQIPRLRIEKHLTAVILVELWMSPLPRYLLVVFVIFEDLRFISYTHAWKMLTY
jgi:hypothetical protein